MSGNPCVTFIVGFCGSGKTYLADSLARQGVYKFDEGFLHSKEQHAKLIENIRHQIDCVVVEIAYCRPAARTKILKELAREVPGVDIKWIFFANNLTAANRNCWLRRNKGHSRKHIRLNQRLASEYEIPLWASPVRITELEPHD